MAPGACEPCGAEADVQYVDSAEPPVWRAGCARCGVTVSVIAGSSDPSDPARAIALVAWRRTGAAEARDPGRGLLPLVERACKWVSWAADRTAHLAIDDEREAARLLGDLVELRERLRESRQHPPPSRELPQRCVVDRLSARYCRKGTKGCIRHHCVCSEFGVCTEHMGAVG